MNLKLVSSSEIFLFIFYEQTLYLFLSFLRLTKNEVASSTLFSEQLKMIKNNIYKKNNNSNNNDNNNHYDNYNITITTAVTIVCHIHGRLYIYENKTSKRFTICVSLPLNETFCSVGRIEIHAIL